MKQNSRAYAALAVHHTLTTKQPFNPKYTRFFNKIDKTSDKAFAAELCYGTLRNFLYLKAIINQLLKTPLKEKDFDILVLLAVGIYQLKYAKTQEHAAINETVAATIILKKVWAKSLVNAVLRNFLRNKSLLETNLLHDKEASTLHPAWLIDKITKAYPKEYDAIFTANNTKAPLSFRVNTLKTTIKSYLAALQKEQLSYTALPFTTDGFQLDLPVSSEQLPFFNLGQVIIQDSGAQLAAPLLKIRDGQTILDACAAPGNKTAQMFSIAKHINLTAVEKDPQRIITLANNLHKHGVTATVICADIINLNTWWNGIEFDRILLDVPCSATGVMRRHPEIKLLRTQEDINTLVKIQQEILHAIWPTLKIGGILLYVTCSILPEENSQQMAHFIAANANAKELPITLEYGITCDFGCQLLPKINGNDGLYFCRLIKI